MLTDLLLKDHTNVKILIASNKEEIILTDLENP